MSRLARIWLLVLLTALLPIRGALAVAMLCAPVAPASAPAHSEHQGHDMAQHEHHQASGEHQHDSEHSTTDRCSLCASCCTAVPLMSTFPSVPEPFDAPQQFPALHTPAPSFVSDGWERPPRSI